MLPSIDLLISSRTPAEKLHDWTKSCSINALWNFQRVALTDGSDSDGESWRAAWNNSAGDFVLLLDWPQFDQSRLRSVLTLGLQTLTDDQSVAVWLDVGESEGAHRVWTELPPELARLLSRPPFDCIGLLRRSMVDGLGGLRLVSFPLWDLALRMPVSALRVNLPLVSDPPPKLAAELPLLSPNGLSTLPAWLRTRVAKGLQELSGLESAEPADRAALLAGVWQWHDELDTSHSLSQQFEGCGRHRLCDHWHAIMHRREPDYGNSKYWYRQVGNQPVFGELAQRVAAILQPAPGRGDAWRSRLLGRRGWDPMAFVDLAEAAQGDAQLDQLAREIQWWEMFLLLRFTARQCGLSEAV